MAEIAGHPDIELANGTLITVCAACGQMSSILFLDKDRWFCIRCRAEGATAPNVYPVN